MKIILISPPLFNPTGPYLATPSLKAFLEQNGHRVVQKDLNVEFFNKVLSKEYLSNCYKVIRNKFKELKGKKPLSENDKKLYALLKNTVSSAPNIINKVDSAKKFLKEDHSRLKLLSPAALRLNKLWNSNILRSGLNIAGLCYQPTTFTFDEIKMRYSVASSSDILRSVIDRSENLFIDFFEQEALAGILSEDAALVGISININQQVIPGLTLAKLLKEKGCYVVIGGAIFTKDLKIKEEFFSLCDSFVQNEGEHALLELVKQLEGGNNFYDVPNLVWLDKRSNKLIFNKASYVEDLDYLPTPDFEGLPKDRYFRFFDDDVTFPLAVFKGCHWNKCAFCEIIGENKYRTRKIPLIIDDIRKLISDNGVNSFIFTGESPSPGFLKELADGLIKNNLNIKWKGYARFEEEFTESFCQLLAKSGCWRLFIGLESGSQRILDFMHKGTNLTSIRIILSNLHKAGIATHLFVLIGFPTETTEEAQETLNFILDNRDRLDCLDFSFEIDNVYCHRISEISRCPEKYNIKEIRIIDINNDLETRTKRTFVMPNRITLDKAEKLAHYWRYSVHKRFYYYGLWYIILTWGASGNDFLGCLSLLNKFSRHYIKCKVNNFLQGIFPNG